MNKYQESLNFIIKNSCSRKTYCKKYDFEKYCNSIVKQHIDNLQELIDKSSITMKPINALNEDGEPYLPRGVKLCPICGERVNQESNKNYCGNCGGMLDWSEE